MLKLKLLPTAAAVITSIAVKGLATIANEKAMTRFEALTSLSIISPLAAPYVKSSFEYFKVDRPNVEKFIEFGVVAVIPFATNVVLHSCTEDSLGTFALNAAADTIPALMVHCSDEVCSLLRQHGGVDISDL